MRGLSRRFMIPALAILLSVAPACNATAGHKWGQGARTPDGSTRRLSLRPLYEPSRAKSLYLSGYAGANYAPSGRGGLLYPSTYRQATGLGLHSTFNRPWHGQ